MEKTRKTLIIFACLLAFSLLFSICISAVPAKMTVSGRFFGGEVIPDKRYSIRSVADGRYIDVVNALQADGTNVWTYLYNGALCQEWIIENVTGTNEYMIKDSNSGKYLSICASSANDGKNAWIWHNDGTTGQRFRIENFDTNCYKFLTKSSNWTLALAVDPVTHNVYQTNKNSFYTLFALEESSSMQGAPSGKCFINNYDRKYFLTKKDQTGSAPLAIAAKMNDKILSVTLDYRGGGYYYIMLDETNCLSVNNNVASSNATFSAKPANNLSGQLWKIERDGSYVKFKPKCDETYYLCTSYAPTASDDVSEKQLKLSQAPSGMTAFWACHSSSELFETYSQSMIVVEDERHDVPHIRTIINRLKEHNPSVLPYNPFYQLYYRYETADIYKVDEIISKSDNLYIQAHGNVDSSGDVYMQLAPTNFSGQYASLPMRYYCYELPNMEEVDVAFFGVCHSAHGYDTGGLSDNFLTEAVSNGALNAIGYCYASDPKRVSEFYEIFCNQTGTVKMRFEKALGVFSKGANIDETDIPVLLQPTRNRSGEAYMTRWVFDGEVLVSQTTLVKLSFETKENERENREPIEVQITHAEFDGDVYVIKTETAVID